jgi:hypothetical protein
MVDPKDDKETNVEDIPRAGFCLGGYAKTVEAEAG